MTNSDDIDVVSKLFFDVVIEFYVKTDIRFDVVIEPKITKSSEKLIKEINTNSKTFKENKNDFQKNSQNNSNKAPKNSSSSDKINKFESENNNNFRKFPIELSLQASKILENLSKLTTLSFNLHYNHRKYHNGRFFEVNKSLIFLVDSCESYQNIHYEYALVNIYPRPLKFLVYVENCDFEYLALNVEKFIRKKQLGIFSGLIENFEYILVNEGNFLRLLTIEWHTKFACDSVKLTSINTYSKIKRRWEKKLKNHKKYQNFHGCELVFLLYKRNGAEKWGSFTIDSDTQQVQPYGLVPDIFQLISSKFNYKPVFQPAIIDNEVSIFNERSKITLLKTKNPTKIPNVCFELTRFTDEKFIVQHTTTSFLEVRDIILVTPGELYTSFEKLFLPFDDITWQLISLTFLTTFLMIFIINRLPIAAQKLIYGEKVTTPGFNVIITFFGFSQVKLPIKIFPRFILTMFVLFCLIFRTCYQSKLFEFMTNEPRRAPPKTIADLVERNYTMFAPKNFAVGIEIIAGETSWPRMEYVDLAEYSEIILRESQNFSAKLAVIVQSMILDHIETKLKKSLKWLHIKDTFVQVAQSGFTFYMNNFFYQNVDEVVQQLIAAGIMEEIVKGYVGTKWKFVDKNIAKILKVENLSFGFVIWMWCCGICFVVFIGEICVSSALEVLEIFRCLKRKVIRNIDVARRKKILRNDVNLKALKLPLKINEGCKMKFKRKLRIMRNK